MSHCCVILEKQRLYQATVPVILGGDKEKPFLHITLNGELEQPLITFDPATVSLTPVPLGIPSSAAFVIAMSGYRKYVKLWLYL